MTISIRRGFAVVGGLVVLVELISIAVLIVVALGGRQHTAKAIEDLAARDLASARQADTESEVAYGIIEGLALAEVIVLMVTGGATIWLLHRKLYRPLVELDASMARYSAAPGERIHARADGPSEVQRIARTFNEMVDKLADQDRREAAFLAGIAHDLRNPLAVIRGSAEAFLLQPSPSREATERACTRILRQVDAMERMLTDFVDARGIESGMLELTPADNDLCDLAREVTDRFRSSAPSHELVVALPAQSITVHCDRLRLEQVLVNLLTNAIKYSPDGGRVVVGAGRDGPWASLSVSDQGIGIPPDQVASIFEPFRRIAPASAGIAGSGLGLAVSKQIVERHGGRIEVESEAGRGTTFRVLIPSRDEALPAHAPPA